ncbi:MAG: SIR2 family protein [Pseudomonadota bacterium]
MSLPAELQPLCREFDRERPNVIVVVGAGVSFGATGDARASWRGLLEHGVQTLRDEGIWEDQKANANLTLIRDAFSSDFDVDEVLGRAESIAKALGAPGGADYGAWLAGAIGSLRAQEGRTATLDAIRQLEQAGALILTTNYDDLLENAIGLEPVTWQDHREFLRVLNRDRSGVLHIHGHWRQPSSVILGRKSYQRILATAELQDIFKSIWLQWSWLYVGCGNGLDDPNVGRLLHWGETAFGASARKHYFLARAGVAAEFVTRADKPANLVPIGYGDHAELPDYLSALTPRQRPWPFVEVGPTEGPVRHPATSPLDIPLPSWQELLNGEVPALAADASVAASLRTYNWALVYDVASVGKTTLALRLAAGSEYRDHPAFYLDMARIDASDEDELTRIRAAVRRLAHVKALIILDNTHWAPQLTRDVWDWWLDRPRMSRLLMLATRIQHTFGLSGDDALAVVENHASNPAIAVRPIVADMLPILNCVAKRIRGRDAMLKPPEEALTAWHATFSCDMGAFAAAVTGEHHRLELGDWDLPQSAAAGWIRNRHLHPLAPEERENLICLSVFAAQALELSVTEQALPYPEKMAALLRRGLVERRERGRKRYRAYVLREPDLGALLTAAVDPLPDVDEIMLKAACRHAAMALSLGARLSGRGDADRLAKLWQHLCDPVTFELLVAQFVSMPLNYTIDFRAQAIRYGRQDLVDQLSEAWQAEPARLAERAFETPLHFVMSFIEAAATQKRAELVDGLWSALEAEPAQLAERAFETPLAQLGSFMEAAATQKRVKLVAGLWGALEAAPARLAERAFEAALGHLGSFIETAAAQKRTSLVSGLWDVLEGEPARLAERAFETSLVQLGSFIKTAVAQKRVKLVDGLWSTLEAAPEWLAERAIETSLVHLGSFIETAAAQKRATLVDGLWGALEAKPARLAERAFETALGDLGSFIETAATQERIDLVDELWDALEAEPARLAERAFETPLDQLGSFIETAAAQKRAKLVDGLWSALEREPQRLRATVGALYGGNLRAFLTRAPENIGRLVVAKLNVADWSFGNCELAMFSGAPRLATQFANLGREDLASTLRSYLLQSADPRWFAQHAAIFDVAVLLNNLTEFDPRHVEAFVDKICTQRWLAGQYAQFTTSGVLAGALILIALSQPPSILRLFWAPALKWRVSTALTGLANVEREMLSGHVQFIGAAQLMGQRMSRQPFAIARLDLVAKLPLDVLPHRAEADGIESRQRNLWLGLRVVASLADMPPVGRAVIEETLQRWYLALQDSAAAPGHVEHRLNQSMVAWLEACMRTRQGVLFPSREPLWRITGLET